MREDLEQKAHKLANLTGLQGEPLADAIEAVLAGLPDDDAEAVMDRAADISEQRAASAEAEADALERLGRLAQATGCPPGTPPAAWLIQQGLLRRDGDGYVFTDKAKGLRPV